MRYQKAIMMVASIAMAMLTLTGTALTDQFPQAASAQSVGFDALAHDLFDSALIASADDEVAEAQ
jgi:cytochrome b subunit of formate dehydrogenase